MEVKAQKFETEFSVQATAMINYVLSSFEGFEAGFKEVQSALKEATAEIEKLTKEKVESQERFNNIAKEVQTQKVEIQRLSKLLLDNGIAPTQQPENPTSGS